MKYSEGTIGGLGSGLLFYKADRGQVYYFIITKRKVNEILRGNN